MVSTSGGLSSSARLLSPSFSALPAAGTSSTTGAPHRDCCAQYSEGPLGAAETLQGQPRGALWSHAHVQHTWRTKPVFFFALISTNTMQYTLRVGQAIGVHLCGPSCLTVTPQCPISPGAERDEGHCLDWNEVVRKQAQLFQSNSVTLIALPPNEETKHGRFSVGEHSRGCCGQLAMRSLNL